MNPVELARLIRFELSQLSRRNEHHQFEELCLELARARICSNIIAATGPVAAGGDQGRDFETFRTYLTATEGAFAGRTASEDIVFACSLQRDGLPGKIKTDVTTAVKYPGLHVDAVVYFAEQPVNIATRHELEAWASKEHDIRLQIFDGSAIADMLRDFDVAWIAQEYLRLPAEIFPEEPPEADESWYSALRTKWQLNPAPALTFGDFFDVRSGLRHAYQSTEFLEHVEWWISIMEQFDVPEAGDHLRRKAFYEVVVASLRGLELIDPYIDRLKAYFEETPSVMASGNLEDVQVLLMYCYGAVRHGLTTFGLSEVMAWRRILAEHLEAEIAAADYAARRCPLLVTLGATKLILDAPPVSQEVGRRAFEEAALLWNEALDLADNATLFPVERVADLMPALAPAFASEPSYRDLVRRLDKVVAERAGQSAAAEKCRDRALALFKAEKYVLALREFHDARLGWLTGDTIRGSVLAMFLISRCYEQLGLEMAAKYYVLAAASIALDSGDDELADLISQGTILAALMDYKQGAWFGCGELSRIGLRAHVLLDEDAWDFDKHELLTHIGLPLCSMAAVAELHFPEAQKLVREWLDDSGFMPIWEGIRGESGNPWEGKSKDELIASVREQLDAIPFSDLGPARSYVWNALGIRWTVTVENEWASVMAAERFVAMAQIMLCDLADVDLALLPTSIEARVSITDNLNGSAEAKPSNEGRLWEIQLSNRLTNADADLNEFQVPTIAAIIAMLAEVSTVSQETVMKAVHRSFEAGVASKLTPGYVYDDLFVKFMDEERFARGERTALSPMAPSEEVRQESHAELRWNGSLGPNYSREKAESFLTNRYEALIPATRATRARLVGNQQFGETLAKLRQDGWRDWQVMLALHVAKVNWLGNLARPASPDELQDLFKRLQGEEDPDGPAVPLGVLTEEHLRWTHSMNNMSALQGTWGHELHMKTPDLPAIDRFLSARYRHYADDIEHEEAFPPPA